MAQTTEPQATSDILSVLPQGGTDNPVCAVVAFGDAVSTDKKYDVACGSVVCATLR
ncbi:MAG: hypothetical protein LBT53_05950 [Puniceicoccales bacterium]|nr:hypothetical protein [Puniceicoccales bacterium]